MFRFLIPLGWLDRPLSGFRITCSDFASCHVDGGSEFPVRLRVGARLPGVIERSLGDESLMDDVCQRAVAATVAAANSPTPSRPADLRLK